MKAIHNGDWRNLVFHLLIFLKSLYAFFSDEEMYLIGMVKDYTHKLNHSFIHLSEHLKSPM